jgi:hypothetical protein
LKHDTKEISNCLKTTHFFPEMIENCRQFDLL